jgi:hypothetical protein
LAGSNYFLLAALPPLGQPGSVPPISRCDLLDLIGDDDQVRQLARTVLLADDLVQRDAVLAGEIKDPHTVVLTPAQARDEAPLPSELTARGEADTHGPAHAGVDRVWENFFRHAAAVAKERGSALLGEWVGYEVALRNALAETRAKALELDAAAYLVAPELGDNMSDFTLLLGEWSSAPNPLEGLKVLDRARWAWLATHDRYYSFSNDELVAYTLRLMLLQRWHRLETTEVTDPIEPKPPQETE